MILNILDGCKDITEAKEKLNELITENFTKKGANVCHIDESGMSDTGYRSMPLPEVPFRST